MAILAGLAFGILLPDLVQGWFDGVVFIFLIVLVYSLALGAQFGDILRSLRNVRFFAVAWFMNFVVIPLVAFVLALAFLGPYPAIFVGFILYSIAPCTDWFLIFTSMAKGDVPLGLALLPTNLVLQVVLIPVYLFLFAGLMVPFQVSALVETFAVFIVLPFALAGVTRWAMKRARSEEWRNDVLGRTLPNLQVMTLVVIIFFIFASQADVILENLGPLSIIIVPTALLFVIAFTLSQLQRVVEALVGVPLHKQNFRRLVEGAGLVEGTGSRAEDTGGRPAELFRFRREVLRERPAPGMNLPGRR
jgi:ACR3 family arsenite efflux pump ArsB